MNIYFEAIVNEIDSRKVIKIPISSSKQLPSRGMVMIQGTINDIPFIVPLEPDGMGSHWFYVNDTIFSEAGIMVNTTVSVGIEPINEWIEPEIPEDIIAAINNGGLIAEWNDLTTKARWEWLRWIRSTKNPATRQKRIEVACSKLQKGDRRPCCFDATRCSIPEVSKSGVLMI